MSAEQYRNLPVERVVANPDQPRRHFEPEALAELGRSIADQGLLQAIVVRPVGPDTYMIVAGERRWRAHKAVGLTTISARVLDITEQDAFALSVLENVTRADMRPMDEARAYATLRASGKTVAEIAAATGKTERWVTMFMDLLRLVPELQAVLDAGDIKVGVAWSASRCDPDGQRVLLRKYAAGEFASDRDAQAFATALVEAGEQGGLFADPETPEEKERIVKDRAVLANRLKRLGVAGWVLGEIAGMEPAQVARLLAGEGGGVAAHQAAVKDVAEQAARALAVLRKAGAIAAAATVELEEIA